MCAIMEHGLHHSFFCSQSRLVYIVCWSSSTELVATNRRTNRRPCEPAQRRSCFSEKTRLPLPIFFVPVDTIRAMDNCNQYIHDQNSATKNMYPIIGRPRDLKYSRASRGGNITLPRYSYKLKKLNSMEWNSRQ
jgi:hypothetical protein